MNQTNDDRGKWAFLQTAPTVDAKTSEIRSLAASICMLADRTATPKWSRAHLCHALARDCISYRTDGERCGREQIDGWTDPQGLTDAPLRRGVDDCDAKARLFVALCLATGLRAEMRPMPPAAAVEAGEPLSHVYAAVLLPRRTVLNSGAVELSALDWYPVETILSRATIGSEPFTTPKECAGERIGRWLYP